MIERWIKLYHAVKRITLYESSSKTGFHCIVGTFYYISPTRRFELRKEWFDDPERLRQDIKFKGSYFRDVLFDTKTVNGIKHKRRKIFIFEREKPSSEWQKIPLK